MGSERIAEQNQHLMPFCFVIDLDAWKNHKSQRTADVCKATKAAMQNMHWQNIIVTMIYLGVPQQMMIEKVESSETFMTAEDIYVSRWESLTSGAYHEVRITAGMAVIDNEAIVFLRYSVSSMSVLDGLAPFMYRRLALYFLLGPCWQRR